MTNPVGEDNWLEHVERQIRQATDLEGRVRVIESFQRATLAEPGSLKLWIAYCEYFWSLYVDCNQRGNEIGWPQDELAIGRETFTFDAALNLWQEGYEAVQYRLSDSHELWNRWVSHEMELLRRTTTEAGVRRITQLFKNRLLVPHATWNETSQMFSTFLSEYNRHAWETEMEQITRNAQGAKKLYEQRDPWEMKLAAATRSRDAAAMRSVMTEYLDWEIKQAKTRKDRDEAIACFQICLGLFSRALTGVLSSDENTWMNYIVFVSTTHTDIKEGRSPVPGHMVPDMLDALSRSVKHVPWCGALWARYILAAEESGLSFSDIEQIKHSATDNGQLDRDGMMGVLEMYAAWCGYLKRTAMVPDASEEAVDVAEVGLLSALEDVKHWGTRKYDNYQGDPQYRLEKILIQFLTEKKDDIDGARAVWEDLAKNPLHAGKYDFWLNWYFWEMMVFTTLRNRTPSPTPTNACQALRVPTFATEVLTRALKVRGLNWPDRVMEIYLQHCNDYETAETLREAQDTVLKTRKALAKRREREAAQAAQVAQVQWAAQTVNSADYHMVDVSETVGSPGSKRKREETPEDGTGSKRAKNENNDEERLKRDRENTSVFVLDLPAEVTQTKLKQFFREYGHINNIDIQKRDGEVVALVEFKTSDEAKSALLRDGKYLGDRVVRVQPATDCTLFVTNYPPDADERYIRHLFKDCGEIHSIRFPSLKYNTKRRFCYVTFRNREAATAATKLDGKPLSDGKYKLVAKFSDPLAKQQRHGAQAEERELHVINLPRGTSEEDISGLFSKAGRVVSVRVPRNMAGQSHGTAFVVMETKEQAQEAIRLCDKLIFGNHPIKVELSRPTTTKTTAVARVMDGTPEPQEGQGMPTPAEIAARTIAVLGIPDTMTDARVRAALTSATNAPIVKLVLHPVHGGAIVEFADAAAAGKAALSIDGMEIEPGKKVRTGTTQELFRNKAEKRVDRIDKPHSQPQSHAHPLQQQASQDKKSAAELMPPPTLLRRPGSGPKLKRGLGFVGAISAKKSAPATINGEQGQTGSKSNEDFRKFFLASRTAANAEGEAKNGNSGQG
ncbi:splicing factor (prp24)-like protein [Thermochaetoides thermophila DSM 1495]|uniref:U4/U6 snRNA-associated-splicing factor PRP24 n=1 Tax=Chaetomium thermophilum (strain DSM 1495 / CBS 144.50 / IMI 039719) TaxID=759272 RepID=G0S9S9_CHATD|nr:splicing factor (prp24)-like protein [Thermochaetoides thermophila DSM 1495]EGS20190.1 splicing factor (prp24)-like protein [Thermochaetoides thermophila DSM 1495]